MAVVPITTWHIQTPHGAGISGKSSSPHHTNPWGSSACCRMNFGWVLSSPGWPDPDLEKPVLPNLAWPVAAGVPEWGELWGAGPSHSGMCSALQLFLTTWLPPSHGQAAIPGSVFFLEAGDGHPRDNHGFVSPTAGSQIPLQTLWDFSGLEGQATSLPAPEMFWASPTRPCWISQTRS